MQLPEITLDIVPGIGALVVPYRRWPKAAAVFHGMLRQADRLKATHAHELGMVDTLANDYRGLILAAIERVTVQLRLRRVFRLSRKAASLISRRLRKWSRESGCRHLGPVVPLVPTKS